MCIAWHNAVCWDGQLGKDSSADEMAEIVLKSQEKLLKISKKSGGGQELSILENTVAFGEISIKADAAIGKSGQCDEIRHFEAKAPLGAWKDTHNALP